MNQKQLLALFVCSLVPWTIGNGLLPLLPVYAVQVGATPAMVGYYLSFSYLALATGTVIGGWLSDKLQRRKLLLIAASVVGTPIIWLMGQSPSVLCLTALTAALWFSGGVGLTLVSILAGLFAEETERGKVFGILSFTGGLGALIGGLTTGPIANRWGYSIMFAALSLFAILWPLAGLLLEDKVIVQIQRDMVSTVGEKARLGRSFFLLFLASTVVNVTYFASLMGRSLAMNDLGFAAAGISSTGAVSGAVTLPLSPLSGWLSDRVGRKRLLVLCYLAAVGGLLLLTVSVSLWHFWAVASLMYAMSSVNSAVGPALVTDLVSRESLGKAISLFSATTWIGGVIGFVGTGHAVQDLGMVTTLVIGAFLAVMAIVLLIPIRQVEKEEGSVATPGN
jgi:MFS family permease